MKLVYKVYLGVWYDLHRLQVFLQRVNPNLEIHFICDTIAFREKFSFCGLNTRSNNSGFSDEIYASLSSSFITWLNKETGKTIVPIIIIQSLLQNSYQGFLVAKDLKLKPENFTPSGFCIQRTEINPDIMFSNYMKKKYSTTTGLRLWE